MFSTLAGNELKEFVDINGYAVVPEVVPLDLIERLRQLTDRARESDSAQRVMSAGGTFALRNLTDAVPEVCALLHIPALRKILADVIGGPAFLIRATLFDKTPSANWGVFWHQDLAIAVREKHEVDGYRAWTCKT
ncbi:MAG: hypothetical protein KDA85_17920, partial [Planctomycetaceae bacterium]|nr:hypothetical protein [Planctomycetaceae bacterium]